MNASQSEPGPLPRAYALLLKSYPRGWRADGRGDELLAVLLDGARAADRRTPTLADCWDVGVHGIAERLGGFGRLISNDVRLRVAQVCVIAGSALAVFLVLCGELRIPHLSDGLSPNHLDEFLRDDAGGPFLTVGVAVYATWLLVLGTYLHGAPRACRELALISIGIVLLVPLLGALTDHQRPPGGLLAAMAVLGVGAAGLPVRTRPTVRRRVVTVVAMLGLVAALIAWRLRSLQNIPSGFTRSWLTSRPMFYWNPQGNHLQINRALAVPGTWVVTIAMVLALGAAFWNRAWLPVAAFLVVPLGCLRLGRTTLWSSPAQREALIWACSALGLLVLNAIVASRVVTSRRRGNRGGAAPAVHRHSLTRTMRAG